MKSGFKFHNFTLIPHVIANKKYTKGRVLERNIAMGTSWKVKLLLKMIENVKVIKLLPRHTLQLGGISSLFIWRFSSLLISLNLYSLTLPCHADYSVTV